MVIAMSHRPFEVFAHERAFREHAGKQEREKDSESAVNRKAGIEMDRVRRSRNGLADRADAAKPLLKASGRSRVRVETPKPSRHVQAEHSLYPQFQHLP
jgi:transposase